MVRAALLLAAAALVVLSASHAAATHGATPALTRIQGDSDLVILKNAGHLSGSGTSADPYRLLGITSAVASTGTGIEITGTTLHLNISGMAITAGGSQHDGIRLVNARNVTVWGSTLETNRNGIVILSSANITIAGNTIKTSQVGVSLESSRDVSLRDNRLALNDKDVVFRQATTNTLLNNNLTTATGQYGLFFEDNVSYDNAIDATNTVNSIPVRWYTRLAGTPSNPVVLSDVTVDLDKMTNVAQVMVHNSTHVRLERVVANAGTGSGIHVFQSQNVQLVRPTTEGNGAGILVEMSPSTSISNASARANRGDAILVRSSDGALVDWSTLSDNLGHGVKASFSNATTLRQLTLASNTGSGVHLDNARNTTVESSSLSSNGATQLALTSSYDAIVRANTMSATGAGTGLSITSSTARVEANTLRDLGTDVRFVASTGSNFTDNVISLSLGGTAFSFDGPGSYDNAIAPTNLVNGTAVRWYTNVAGTQASPIVLPSLRVETAGITNVGQIMLYKTANVTLTSPIAKNGTAAGIVVYQAHDSNVSAATVAASAAQGVLVHESRGAKVLASTITTSGGEGIKLLSSGGALLENNVVQSGRANGIGVVTSDAPTLRGNAVSGNTGTGVHLDRVGPGGVAADNNVIQANVAGGFVASQSTVGSIRSNTIASNGADGLHLSNVPVGARIEANTVSNHTRNIRLALAGGTELTSNVVTVGSGQTGFHFDDETSYNVTLPSSNTVNGVPLQWHVGTAGPVTISGVRAEVRGMTNVAQVMLYKVSNVTLTGAVASNGTDRGVYVLRSENVTVQASRAENNSRAGIHLESSKDVRVDASNSTLNAQEGLLVKATTGAWVSASTSERNGAAGVSVDSSPAPGARLENLTVRQNRGGINVGSSTFATIHANMVTANGATGIALSQATGGNVTNNTFDDHTRGVELSGTARVGFRNNTITKLTNQTGYQFADETSYRNAITDTNVVNGVPMRWYWEASGLSLNGVRVELPGITNVAQMMIHESANVVLNDLRLANGTARGLYLYHAAAATITNATAENNTGAGMHIVGDSTATVRNSTLRANGGHGFHAVVPGSIVLDNATVASNGGSGATLQPGSAVITSSTFERNVGNGLTIEGGEQRVLVSTFEANGAIGLQSRLSASTGLNVSGSVFRTNVAGGLSVDRSMNAALYDNELTGNGAFGILIDTATAPTRVGGNRATNHTRALELRTTEFGDFQGNAFTILPGQTGWHFADERSYNNVIPTSNTVNGLPVQWLTTLTGTETSPVTLTGVRGELRGITNVAQVMVYRSSHLKLPDVVATNGTARGVYLYRSSSVALDGGNATNNSLYGVHLHSTQSSAVRDLAAQASGVGVQLTDSLNNVVLRVNASGATTGVVLQDGGSRDNRVEQIETNGTARGVTDAAWNEQGLAGNNLIADAGTAKRAKIGANLAFSDTTATYRLDSSRIVSQTWSWGDGTPDATSTAATLLRPTHAYAAFGVYRANLTVVTADGLTLADSIMVEVVPPLSGPRTLTALSGARNATLSWTPPEFDGASAITKYRIYRGVNATDVPFVAEVPFTTQTYVDTDLENGRQYVYLVSAVNADGEGPKTFVAVTPAAPPSAPVSLAASSLPNAAALTWSAPTDRGGLPVTSYLVLRATNGTALFTVATIGNVTNYTDRGLVNGVQYTFAVRAVNGLGIGALSGNASTTPIGPPGPPRELRVLPGDASATLVWAPPADTGGTPVTGYRVWRGASNETLVALPDALLPNASSFRDTGLSNGQRYVFAVSAINAFGEGNQSAGVSGVPQAIDALRPVVFAQDPADGSRIGASPATISAQYVDNDGVVVDDVRVYVDESQVGANVTATGFAYTVPSPLERGFHTVRVVLRDPTGNEANVTWTFRILTAEERVPSFVFENLTLAPTRVAPGANVTAFATVRNVGFAAGNATVSALLGENALEHAIVELDEGASADVVLEFAAPLVLGEYNITLAGTTLALIVADPEVPEDAAPEEPSPETPTPTAEGPKRPVRATPPPRPSAEAGVPGPGLLVVLAAMALVALRRRA